MTVPFDQTLLLQDPVCLLCDPSQGAASCSLALPGQLETKGIRVVGAGMDFLPAGAASLISEDTFNIVPFRTLKYLYYMGYVEMTLALKCMLYMGRVCCQQGTGKYSFVLGRAAGGLRWVASKKLVGKWHFTGLLL